MKEFLDNYLPDKYLVRAALTLVALIILIPGVFRLGPPRWFGDEHVMVVIAKDVTQDISQDEPGDDTNDVSGEISGADAQDGYGQLPEPASDPEPEADLEPKLDETTELASTETPAALALPVEEPTVRASQPKTKPKTKPKSNLAKPSIDTGQDPDEPLNITRVITKKLPPPDEDLTPNEQKTQFVTIVLPLVLASNEEIVQRRMAIQRAAANDDLSSLRKWARLYRIDDEDASIADLEAQLLTRADVIPVPIVLAQAAVESGWGTSRFAQQGNALFGQWAWDKSQGIAPLEASDERAVVRSFPNLFGSVRAYMHNLNTHFRYEEFRQERLSLADKSAAIRADRLVTYLDGYAEVGYEYVVKLQDIITTNDFDKYADARLN